MSDPIDTGGPAFPQAVGITTGEHVTSGDFEGGEGMALRDYFAAQALIGLILHRLNADTYRRYRDGHADGTEAVVAYAIADTMLKARKPETL
jgi:hypothetical protein